MKTYATGRTINQSSGSVRCIFSSFCPNSFWKSNFYFLLVIKIGLFPNLSPNFICTFPRAGNVIIYKMCHILSMQSQVFKLPEHRSWQTRSGDGVLLDASRVSDCAKKKIGLVRHIFKNHVQVQQCNGSPAVH